MDYFNHSIQQSDICDDKASQPFILEVLKNSGFNPYRGSLVLYAGTDGIHNKVSLTFVEAAKGECLAQIAFGPAVLFIKNEVNMMGELMRKGQSHLVPQIYHFEWTENYAFVVKEFLNGKKVTDLNKAIKILFSINQTLIHQPLGTTRLHENLTRQVQLLSTSEDTPKRLALLLHRTKNLQLPCGLCHRDFYYRNIIQSNKGIKVVDWEFSLFGYPIILDALHFVIHLPPATSDSKMKNYLWLMNKWRNLFDKTFLGDIHHNREFLWLTQLYLYDMITLRQATSLCFTSYENEFLTLLSSIYSGFE